MKEEEAAEGAGAQGALEGDPGDPSVPARCATRGLCCRAARSRRAVLPAPAALRARCFSARPAFSAPPTPLSGTTGAAAPPTPPLPGRRP